VASHPEHVAAVAVAANMRALGPAGRA
jgi:hypothetical protein